MKKTITNIGIIGYGYWGPNLARNFFNLNEVCLKTICDLRHDRLSKLKKNYPSVQTTTHLSDIFNDTSINAVAIATPVSTHFDLAMAALKAGKHVLVEKPLSSTTEQATKLIEEASRRNLVLMVGHTFVYNGAVKKLRELVANKTLGDIYYYDSVRINLGLFQHDINVIWDLAVHDLSILDYVMPSMQPTIVSATGMGHVIGNPENIAYITLFFSNNLIAHIHVNWLAPVKVRRTLICGDKKMIVYDDLEPSERIKIYDSGIAINNKQNDIYKMLIDYRAGDMLAPHLDLTEALHNEVLHFIECIKNKKSPITNGEAGRRIVSILEAANQSMKKNGKPIKLNISKCKK